jgi:hypothetical protein
MHNLIAFSSSIVNGSVYAQVLGAPDQSMPMDSANRFIMPGPWQMLAAHAAQANLTAARVNSPSLRGMFVPEIYPGRVAATPGNTNGPITFHGRGPRLVQNEGVEVDISAGGAAAAQAFCALWVAPSIVPAPQGAVYTMPATATITAALGVWAFGTLAFSQTLPAGRYAVVGLGVVAANTMYARLVYPGVSNFRPGVVVQGTYGDQPIDDYFRYGRMGSFGEFESTALPQLEVFGTGAGAAAPTAYLDLVKVR